MSKKTVNGIATDSEDIRRALTSADRIGKVFVAVRADIRKCLICDEVFTRQGAAEHAEMVCHPRGKTLIA